MLAMDLLDKVKDKLPAEKLTELQQWYQWCDETAEKYAKQVRGKLAFELGHIPPPLLSAMKEAFVAAMREAGRHVVTTKLVETNKADPPPAEAGQPRGQTKYSSVPDEANLNSRVAVHHRDDDSTGPGPDSPYIPDGVFGDGGEPK
jgi:hypothetical protein